MQKKTKLKWLRDKRESAAKSELRVSSVRVICRANTDSSRLTTERFYTLDSLLVTSDKDWVVCDVYYLSRARGGGAPTGESTQL